MSSGATPESSAYFGTLPWLSVGVYARGPWTRIARFPGFQNLQYALLHDNEDVTIPSHGVRLGCFRRFCSRGLRRLYAQERTRLAPTIIQYACLDRLLHSEGDVNLHAIPMQRGTFLRAMEDINGYMSIAPFKHWGGIVKGAEGIWLEYLADSFSRTSAMSTGASTTISPSDLLLSRTPLERPEDEIDDVLYTFMRLTANEIRSRMNIIASNLEAVAFHLSYLFKGNRDFPETMKQLEEEIGFTGHNPFSDGSCRNRLVELRGPLCMSVGISPLCILIPKRLHSRPPSQELLFNIWIARGNRPPPELVAVENRIVEAAVQLITSREPTMLVLSSLFVDLANLLPPDDYANFDWFARPSSVRTSPPPTDQLVTPSVSPSSSPRPPSPDPPSPDPPFAGPPSPDPPFDGPPSPDPTFAGPPSPDPTFAGPPSPEPSSLALPQLDDIDPRQSRPPSASPVGPAGRPMSPDPSASNEPLNTSVYPLFTLYPPTIDKVDQNTAYSPVNHATYPAFLLYPPSNIKPVPTKPISPTAPLNCTGYPTFDLYPVLGCQNPNVQTGREAVQSVDKVSLNIPPRFVATVPLNLSTYPKFVLYPPVHTDDPMDVDESRGPGDKDAEPVIPEDQDEDVDMDDSGNYTDKEAADDAPKKKKPKSNSSKASSDGVVYLHAVINPDYALDSCFRSLPPVLKTSTSPPGKTASDKIFLAIIGQMKTFEWLPFFHHEQDLQRFSALLQQVRSQPMLRNLDARNSSTSSMLNSLRLTNVILYGQDIPSVTFDKNGAKMLRSLSRRTTLEDFLLSPEGASRSVVGTALDVILARSPSTFRALCGSSFPLTSDFEEPQPYDTSMMAWNCFSLEGTYYRFQAFPVPSLKTGIVSSGSTFTDFGRAPFGLATAVVPQTGSVICFIATPKQEVDAMRLPAAFPSCAEDMAIFDIEVVVVEPGMRLLLQPGTRCFLVAPKASICIRSYFYTFSNMQATIANMVQAFVHGDSQPWGEASSPPLLLLVRMLAFIHNHYVKDDGADLNDDESVHIPDLMRMESVLDVFALCLFFIIGGAIQRWSYVSPTQVEERLAMIGARKRSRGFIAWFIAHYQLIRPDKTEMDARTDLLEKWLGEIGAAIYISKEKAEAEQTATRSFCSAKEVNTVVDRLIRFEGDTRRHYEHFARGAGTPSISWKGSSFEVKKRSTPQTISPVYGVTYDDIFAKMPSDCPDETLLPPKMRRGKQGRKRKACT